MIILLAGKRDASDSHAVVAPTQNPESRAGLSTGILWRIAGSGAHTGN
jgi:hypothetical protein